MLRAERRLSQEHIAQRIGVSQAQYSKIERGLQPDGQTLRRIAQVLRVRVSELCGGEAVAS